MSLENFLINTKDFIVQKCVYVKGFVTTLALQCWKQDHRIESRYNCIGVSRPAGRIFQAPNHELRHHGRIQYVYFDADTFIRQFMNTDERIMVRIADANVQRDIERFTFKVSDCEIRDSVIKNRNIKEIHIDGEKGSLIVRLPYTRAEGGGCFVYVVDTSNI